MNVTNFVTGKEDQPFAPNFGELDIVRLKKPIMVKGQALASGLTGTIVYCHGVEAYEVEFSGLNDIFQIYAEDLEKA